MDNKAFNTKGWVVSALFLLVVLALGVATVFIKFFGSTNADQPVTSPAHSSQTQQSVVTEKDASKESDSKESSECSFEGVDLTAEPKEGFVSDWVPWGDRVKIPVSAHGAKVLDGIPHCFAPSGEGAVLAAATYASLVLSGEKHVEVNEAFLYPNEFSKIALEQVRSRPVTPQPPIELKGWLVQPTDEPDRFVVYIAFSRPDAPNKLISWGMEMKYHNGDWKFVATENTKATITEIFSVEQSGYKRW